MLQAAATFWKFKKWLIFIIDFIYLDLFVYFETGPAL